MKQREGRECEEDPKIREEAGGGASAKALRQTRALCLKRPEAQCPVTVGRSPQRRGQKSRWWLLLQGPEAVMGTFI